MLCDISEDTTLLLAWVLYFSLTETPAGVQLSPAFVQELLYHGDPLDLLRPQASAAPRASSRTGLIIQPFFWALAIAMVDLANARRGAVDRESEENRSIAVLETGRVKQSIHDAVCTFVELAAAFLHENAPPTQQTSSLPCGQTAALFVACGVCPGILPCRRFTSTVCRPEVCMCTHGAVHHVMIHPRMLQAAGGVEYMPAEEGKQACIEGPLRGDCAAGSRARSVQPAASWSKVVELLRHGSSFISTIRALDVRDILGLKRTAGSIEGRLPPSRRSLLASLNNLHVVPAMTKQQQGGGDRGIV